VKVPIRLGKREEVGKARVSEETTEDQGESKEAPRHYCLVYHGSIQLPMRNLKEAVSKGTT